MLRACGAAKIIVFEVTEQRRALSVKMGADAAFDPTKVKPVEVVMEQTDGQGADLQVEAAGAFTHTFPAMEDSTSLLGKIVVIGRDAAKVEIYPEPLQVKRGIVVFAKGNAGMGIYPNVLRLMASGRIDPRPMITAKFPFGEIPKALETSKARGHGKILIDVA
jgi:threonine dehydrogenase-like Zn-dependent dehydrogenase